MQEVILVTENDTEVGRCEKMYAHEQGLLHRAFSIFLFNSHGEMLLHKRAMAKYHSGGLWTNACCSHPAPDVPIELSLQERLQFEMGMQCPLAHAFHFVYKAHLDHEMIEHEFDHVYIGVTDARPDPNPKEVDEWQYFNTEELQKMIEKNPELFTAWFKIALPKVLKHIENKKLWVA